MQAQTPGLASSKVVRPRNVREVGAKLAVLECLERSKYSLRTILLLNGRGSVTLGWILRHIPASPGTLIRCVRVLEAAELLQSYPEAGSRRRRLYCLTDFGTAVACEPPTTWSDLRRRLYAHSPKRELDPR